MYVFASQGINAHAVSEPEYTIQPYSSSVYAWIRFVPHSASLREPQKCRPAKVGATTKYSSVDPIFRRTARQMVWQELEGY